VTDWHLAHASTQYVAGIGVATILPDFDFETYSEAGLVWNPLEQKWDSPPGLSNQNRGLKAVGTRNYVEHHSFEVLSLAWNLKDGNGVQWWRPDPSVPYKQYPRYEPNHAYDCPVRLGSHCECSNLLHPVSLLEHIAAGRPLEAHNVGFEWTVWNVHCVPVLGWPPFHCDEHGLPPL
jgi:hypothetical protein